MTSLYLLFKFIHVVSVIVWIGGGVAMVTFNALLARENDRSAQMTLAHLSSRYGKQVISPAAVITLLAGVFMVLASPSLSFSLLWITWGFVGILGSVLLGALLTARTLRGITALGADGAGDTARLGALQQRLGLLSFLDLLLLLSTVWAMVYKPTL